MRRREFLATGLVGIGAVTAGCGALASGRAEVALEPVATDTTEDGRRKRLTYGTDEARLLWIAIRQPLARASVTDEFTLTLEIGPGSGLETSDGAASFERLRCDLEVPRAAASKPAPVYVQPPDGAGRPGVLSRRSAEGSTILRLSTPVSAAQLPIAVPIHVDPMGAEVDAIEGRLDVRLETDGQAYTVVDRWSFAPRVAPGPDPGRSRGRGRG